MAESWFLKAPLVLQADGELKKIKTHPYIFPSYFLSWKFFVEFQIPVPSQESLLLPALLVYALRLAPASYGPQEDAALYGSNK